MVEMEMKGGCCNLVLVRGRSYVILGVTILTGYSSRTSPTILQTNMASLHLTYIYLYICVCVWMYVGVCVLEKQIYIRQIVIMYPHASSKAFVLWVSFALRLFFPYRVHSIV